MLAQLNEKCANGMGGCGKKGATIGCFITSCKFSYHFPCAIATGWEFRRSRRFFCPTHRQGNHDVEVHCICGKVDPDNSDPYIQCDGCDDWYHPACVGLTEDDAEELDSWRCITCEPNQMVAGEEEDPDELFCVCQQPYEGFYVGCESCAGWFHPKVTLKFYASQRIVTLRVINLFGTY